MVEIEGIKYYTIEEYLKANNKQFMDMMDSILNPSKNMYINDLFGWFPVSNKTQTMINCYINSDREHVVADLESLGFIANSYVPDLRMRVDKKYIYIHIKSKQHKPLDKRINLKLDRREYTKSKLRKEINRG